MACGPLVLKQPLVPFSSSFLTQKFTIMAKFRSLFRVSGDIGDVNFYEKDGQKYMRQTTSLDKDRIANDPAFQRTRENNREFSGAAAAGKSLRLGLSSVLKRFADNRFGARLLRTFKKVQRGSVTGARGQRPVEVMPQRSKLVGQSLHRESLLSAIFTAPFTLTPSVSRNSVTLDIPVFDIDTQVTAPQGATHFKMVLVIAALSDQVWDADEASYIPMDPDLNGLNATEMSVEQDLDVPMVAPIQLVASLPGNPTMLSTTGLVACVGIEFYQQVTGNLYVLASDNAMKIVDVF